MHEPAHILLIDDDPLVRLLVSNALRTAGFTVSEAAGGEAGLAIFKDIGADAVLLDVLMPDGMDGFAACAALRALPNGRHIPVLMMTGLEDIESIQHAFETGATDFITKPINIPLLNYRIRYMLRASQTTVHLWESEQRLHRLAYFDSLTELPNRQFFKENLQRLIGLAERQQMKLAVLFLDLDGFKRINDTLGHHLGDLVLQATSERLRNSIRTRDEALCRDNPQDNPTLARLGGDEFTVLISMINRKDDVACVAERIRLNLNQPLIIGDHELYMATSIGIAIYPDDGEVAEELLKNADLAMYYAKRRGGNNYQYFTARMSEMALHRLKLESHLRKAVELNELELHYQPQLDIGQGRFCALEALIRWNCRELGRLSPADFIPVAEETGLIVGIGEWVLRQACLQARKLRDSGIPLGRMAVNVSAIQFLHKGFPLLVKRILAETGLEPALLELELTESVLVNDEGVVLNVLQALKQIGVELAIDDFGTGYSSLSRLKSFPIDRLKIDRSFVHNIEQDQDNAAIVIAIIAMAESMNMKVIAEGVETDSQLAFLSQKHCSEAQGFLLSKPLPSAEIFKFLQKELNDHAPF